MIKKLLCLLVLLLTATTGAWATTPNSIVINGTPQVGDKSISLTYHFDPANVSGIKEYVPTLKVKCAADNKWDEMNLSLTEVSSGTTTISLNTLGEFEAGKTYEVCFAYYNGTWVDDVFQSFVPAGPATYAVTLAEGTEEADKWTISPAEGLEGGETVTATYTGERKVKSVKAVKKNTAYAANEYNEASWDGTKVVFTKQTAASDPTAVANSAAAVTWSAGWYTVSGNVTITGNVTLTADAHLILQDGATLTINGQLNCRTNGKNLYIYGQKKGDGKLNVTNNSGNAINSYTGYRIDIHGGEVTAEATGTGLFTGYLAVYGGKLTATSGGGNGIGFGNTIDVYGGEVVATSNATSGACYGIRSSGSNTNQILTVYGGKVTATGNGKTMVPSYGSGFSCHVKSGADIKFYFSDNGTAWDNGTYYLAADAAPNNRYAKAE